ncbi:MAG: DUF4954 family protein [Candidatus Latescibacteria bacterium]|nr:DUF4954 family protein [Candidatus Latescibacterota bacterium]
MQGYRALSKDEIGTMEGAGCSAEDWSKVEVKEGFDPGRVRNADLLGSVRIGDLGGDVAVGGGASLPAGVYDATLVNCELGDNVRVANVRSHMSNYRIGDGAAVLDVGEMSTNPGATFGNGVELEPVNEGGGRELRIFGELSSQFAYLLCMHRYRPEMVERLEAMVDAFVADAKSQVGQVGERALVAHVGKIEDVNVGPHAVVSGAASLINGTILSEEAAPAEVGAGVTAEDFIIGEGSSVDGGAVLSAAFIGQGVQVGKQYSAENSLFFANSECFHGEACSVFGGPYTVTHHKSTLLIAGLFSFYNAGSGSNQSNHMYKLGPVHQGVLERGSKTGSFSYLLWPSVVGPFCVVIGKHMQNFDTGDLPFSYVTEEGGNSHLTPAMNLTTVGTVRDGEKWPARDRRKSTVKRDQIRFEVLSPYLVGKMARGEALLQGLYEETARDVEEVRTRGLRIKRLVLRHGARAYRGAVDLYLNEKIVRRAERAADEGIEAVRAALAAADGSTDCDAWADVSGLLVACDRLSQLETDIESGKIATIGDLQTACKAASDAYEEDEWAWVRKTYQARTGKSLDELTLEDLDAIRAAYRKAAATNINKVLADAEKEFDDVAKFGYGADGNADQAATDFASVRGDFEGNSFVKDMKERLGKLKA